jgi:hypothetical protein
VVPEKKQKDLSGFSSEDGKNAGSKLKSVPAVTGTPTKEESTKLFVDRDPTPRRTNRVTQVTSSNSSSAGATEATASEASAGSIKSADENEKAIHAKIEALDNKGKALFKDKKVCSFVCALSSKILLRSSTMCVECFDIGHRHAVAHLIPIFIFICIFHWCCSTWKPLKPLLRPSTT